MISHGQLDANALPPSLGQKVRDEYENAWQKPQLEIASLSTRGRRIIAERSGHNIIFDQPEILIESILEMIQAANPTVELSKWKVVLGTESPRTGGTSCMIVSDYII